PELTGHENVYLYGAILGMDRWEVTRKFDEIVAFAEIEKFIDTPVKRYSSGMYMRLAFAVAAHMETEILLVDEVLAVGDAEFQKKCLGKMGDVAKEGRTVFFVSHNMLAVKNLCSKAILLDEGRLVCFESVSSVVERYLAIEKVSKGEVVWNSQEDAPGNHQVRLRAVRIVSDGIITGAPPVDKDIEIQVDYWNLEKGGRRLISIHILNAMEYILITSSNMKSASIVPDPWLERKYPMGLFRTKCIIPKLLLNPGQHSINLYINSRGAHDNILFKRNIISFEVKEALHIRKDYQGKWIGAIRPILHWKTTQLEEDITES
ncbi:ABC transporter ATP-binding protein, partial [bacterium]|nr:ABC transporter ATP-binding protein [bacterium]